jgi:PAS domain-containing protein
LSVTDVITTFESFLLRLNPIILVAHRQTQLLSLISRSRVIDKNLMNRAISISETSQNSLIFLNREEIIESFNSSATAIMGFTPEKIFFQ